MANGGLANLGFTCGINTLVQCISHTNKLKNILIKDSEKNITKQLCDVIEKISNEKVSINPGGLIQQIYKCFKGRLNPSEQHDIGELWMLISDKINEEIGVKYDEPNTLIEKQIHKYNNGLISEWTETVQGISRTTIFCNTCKNKTENYEIYSELALNMNNSEPKYVTELMQELIGIEKLEDYVCEKCKEKDSYKNYELIKVPKVLVLILKRFKLTDKGFERINTGVNIPLEITMNSELKYRLRGMGNHFGNYDGGHYTAVCYLENKWYHYDDLNKNEINEDQFKEKNNSVYMLIYESI